MAFGFFSGLGNLLGKKDKVNAPSTPEYYTDPNFSGTQDFLRKYSEGILQGNIPDYYKGIGETMDPSLMKDYVYGLGSDVQGKELAQQALSGRARTGMSNNAIAQVGGLSANARFEDYLRSIQGKQWLMNAGMGGEQDVRNYAQSNMGANNAFNQWKYGADLQREIDRANQSNAFTAQRWGGADQMGDAGAKALAFMLPLMNAGTVGAGGVPTAGVSGIDPTGMGFTSGVINQRGNSPIIAGDIAKVQTKNPSITDFFRKQLLSGVTGYATN